MRACLLWWWLSAGASKAKCSSNSIKNVLWVFTTPHKLNAIRKYLPLHRLGGADTEQLLTMGNKFPGGAGMSKKEEK